MDENQRAFIAANKVLRAEKLGAWGGWLSVFGFFTVILPIIGIILGMEARRSAKEALELGAELTPNAAKAGRNAIIAGVIFLILPSLLALVIILVAH